MTLCEVVVGNRIRPYYLPRLGAPSFLGCLEVIGERPVCLVMLRASIGAKGRCTEAAA